MNRKNIWFLSGMIVSIFLSYYLLHIVKEREVVSTQAYTLTSHNDAKHNLGVRFVDDKNGHFFIHPGENNVSEGTFLFKKTLDIFWDFSIRESGIQGDVAFTLLRHDVPLERFTLKRGEKKRVHLLVHKDDILTVRADKHGSVAYDHGDLHLSTPSEFSLLSHYAFPLLWSLFLFWLWREGYLYVGIVSYLLFLSLLLSEKLTFGALGFSSIMIAAVGSFLWAFMLVSFYQMFGKLRAFKIATILSFFFSSFLFLLPLLFILYALHFDTPVQQDTIYALFQSNADESFSYVSAFVPVGYIMIFLLFFVILGVLLFLQEKQKHTSIDGRLLSFLMGAFFLVSLPHISKLGVPFLLFDSLTHYQHELALFKAVQAQRAKGEIACQALKKQKDETYVVVIGESLNRQHMGIYGYLRDTTPLLSKQKEELLLFDNAYSSHTHTVEVLSQALTESNQYNQKSYFDSFSIIDVLKQASVENYWLSNQTLYGAWDNLVSVIAVSSQHLFSFNKHIGKQTKASHLDGDLLAKLEEVLAKPSHKTRVIFVHLMGSHFSYAKRYPHETFSRFTQPLKRGEFGARVTHSKDINHYDNSVLYNDHVLSAMFALLKREKGVSALLYLSDHGDDVDRGVGHDSAKFSFEMTQIPMFMWCSDAYQKRYVQKYQRMAKRMHTLFSNDMLYDTMIGLFGIKSDRYDARYDLSASAYSFAKEEAKTLHGKKGYLDADNALYWQRHNIQTLAKEYSSIMIVPAHVDTLGAFKGLWRDGMRSFSLDVRVDSTTSSLLVGKSDMPLNTFLAKVSSAKLKQLRLEIKNLNKSNVQIARAYLAVLERRFSIKEKTIIASSYSFEFLDWKRVRILDKKHVDLLKGYGDVKLKRWAKKLQREIASEHIMGISFDSTLAPFVERYLGYHDALLYEVYSDIGIQRADLIASLSEKGWLATKRHLQILLPFYTLYSDK